MKITLETKVWQDVELSERSVDDIVRRKLDDLIYPGEFIKQRDTGQLVLMRADPNWRHGNPDDEFVRLATELDVAVIAVKDALKLKK